MRASAPGQVGYCTTVASHVRVKTKFLRISCKFLKYLGKILKYLDRIFKYLSRILKYLDRILKYLGRILKYFGKILKHMVQSDLCEQNMRERIRRHHRGHFALVQVRGPGLSSLRPRFKFLSAPV